jgi:hypothetical protein
MKAIGFRAIKPGICTSEREIYLILTYLEILQQGFRKALQRLAGLHLAVGFEDTWALS